MFYSVFDIAFINRRKLRMLIIVHKNDYFVDNIQ